jgi:hypothetical protein
MLFTFVGKKSLLSFLKIVRHDKKESLKETGNYDN